MKTGSVTAKSGLDKRFLLLLLVKGAMFAHSDSFIDTRGLIVDMQVGDVTTDSPEAIAAINQFVDQTLSYGNAAEALILRAIAADANCAIAHAYAAAYYLSQESQVGWRLAAPYLQTAQRYASQASVREQLNIQAIAAWAARDIPKAIAIHEAIAIQFPQDLLSVQQGQYHYFYQGNKAGLLRIAEAVFSANPENSYLHGMIAFGLEQCHRLNEAEQWGRQATAINRQDPWAHHAVAHVMETQGRFDEGIAWMEDLADTWEQCNSMLYTHNWWHVALYYLKRGDVQTVLNLYDERVWGRARFNSPKDQVGAIALLLRLELQVGHLSTELHQRWRSLANHLLPRIHEHALPFQDLHYIYALARAGKATQTQAMLRSMNAHAQSCEPSLQRAWATVALPAAMGMVAYAQSDWSQAIAYLKPVLPQLWKIGGSHAQRQLFDQIYHSAVQHSERARFAHATQPMRSYPAAKTSSYRVAIGS